MRVTEDQKNISTIGFKSITKGTSLLSPMLNSLQHLFISVRVRFMRENPSKERLKRVRHRRPETGPPRIGPETGNTNVFLICNR